MYSTKYLDLINLIGYDMSQNYGYDEYKTQEYALGPYHNIPFSINLSLVELLASFSHKNIIALSDINDYKKLLAFYEMNNVTYIDWTYYLKKMNEFNIFTNLNKTIIIKYKLFDISPLLLSTFYILSIIYHDYQIIKTKIIPEYYFMCQLPDNINFEDIKQNEDLLNLKVLINKNLPNITSLFQIVIISDDFINMFNTIISRFVLKELLDTIRIKYSISYTDYNIIHNKLLRKTKRDIKEQTKWLKYVGISEIIKNKSKKS
jgi:hypothetical protein